MSTHPGPAVYSNYTEPVEHVGGMQWVIANPFIAWPYFIICSIMIIFGTTGNIACIGAILLNKTLRHSRNAFLMNMAFSDLFVTAVADPLSVLGMALGKEYFDKQTGLCEVVATFCMAACISSLFSLGAVSFHQCIIICYPEASVKLTSLRSNLLMIGSFWAVGTLISLPPLFGWSSVIFDKKYLECFFNRLHSESYTGFYVGVAIAIPLGIISASYIKIYKHVMASKKRIAASGSKSTKLNASGTNQSLRLAKTLVGIFLVFAGCWGPFSVLIVVDREDRGHMALHLYLLLLAHMHASLNPLVYLATNKHYRFGFRLFFAKVLPCCNIGVKPPAGIGQHAQSSVCG